MNSIISWVGGKKALRDLIYLRMPTHYDRYIEVFGGGGWVLFALFFLVLFLAAVSDIRKRIIPDWMPFLIAGVSLIPSEPVYLTGLFVALPLLIAGITVGGIGGGDIKLTGACGLVLGFERTLSGLLMALMFLLLFHWAGQCIRKCKKINCGVGKEQAYPLVPFLLLGMLMSVRIGG